LTFEYALVAFSNELLIFLLKSCTIRETDKEARHMFIGRQKELEALKKQYAKETFTFMPIYGRRRVGKTQLIEEFIRGKRAIFFTGVHKEPYSQQIARLARTIAMGGAPAAPAAPVAPAVPDTFEGAMEAVYQLAQGGKLILVIDEFPFLAQANQSIVSLLQQFIDLKFLKTNMMLILAGSSLSFMENQVLSTQSPLYGRRTGQIKLLPVNFQTARAFAPRLTKLDQAVMYGVTGGIPKYLSLFDDGLSLDENLARLFFDRNEYLFEEPGSLLKQEYANPALYQGIITAVATGASQMKDILNKTGETRATVTAYLKALLDTGILKKEVPVMEKPDSPKGIYRLEDGMFRFWYRFVYPNASLVALDKGELVYSRVQPQISNFMGEVFEKICVEYLWSVYDSLPVAFQNIGRWWGNNPGLQAQTEIDVIACSEDQRQGIFGECKWKNEALGKNTVEGLLEKSKMFQQFRQKYFYLFSKSGFTPGARGLAEASGNIRLVDFKEMFEFPPA
jgi:AAA+ ATPase superfamily predicted ATPase